jgi:cytochrome c-type biogenesis protein CcmH/NrfG
MSIFRKVRNKNVDSIPAQPLDDRLERAQLLVQSGEYAAAATILEELVATRPQQAIGWYKLGNAQRLLNRTDAALTSYQRAIDLDPRMGRLSVIAVWC